MSGIFTTFVSKLTATARKAFSFLTAFARKGTPQHTVQEILEAAHLEIPADDVRVTYESVKAEIESNKYYIGLEPNLLPEPSKLPDALFKTSRLYSYMTTISGRNINTGLDATQDITIASDYLMSHDDVIETARGIVVSSPDVYNIDIESIRVTGALRNPFFGGFV